MELPVKFKEQMKELLQEEYGDYLQSFDHDRYYGLRVNTLKISVEEFLKISPFKLKPIPWTNDGFYYSSEDKPSKHPLLLCRPLLSSRTQCYVTSTSSSCRRK